MYISNDTYELNTDFPIHMNQIWLKKYNNSNIHYHWHDFYEISYICRGQAVCFVDGEYYPVHEGDIVIFNSGAVHGWEIAENIEDDIELLVLTFSEKMVTSDSYIDGEILGFFQNLTNNFTNILNGKLDATETIRIAMFNAWNEWSNEEPSKNLIVKAELLKILAYLNRYFIEGNVDFEALKKKRKELKRFDQVLRYLDQHYMEKLTVEQVAAVANMSPGHFSKLFHKIMGQRYIDYIIQKRIYRAKELLDTTDRTVIDISMECGFNNTANFYRTYRKFFQKAPRE